MYLNCNGNLIDLNKQIHYINNRNKKINKYAYLQNNNHNTNIKISQTLKSHKQITFWVVKFGLGDNITGTTKYILQSFICVWVFCGLFCCFLWAFKNVFWGKGDNLKNKNLYSIS